jgi:energy-coupling factor transporter ATP-binding protein EcfA2
VEDTPKKEEEKDNTLLSKMMLKDLNLQFKEGEFACIIGDTASGKSSLLNAIIGEMVYVSNGDLEALGGKETTKTGQEFIDI